ncbi:MAG: 2Fe-2S iron-sulfur cluster-binding protein [Pseudomonadota bacterium]
MTGFRTSYLGNTIDRSEPIGFTVDGRQYFGFGGDTLASALIANGVSIVARSFKYHRPRGIMAAGAEEPNALFTVIRDGIREPNIRATEIEVYEGLTVESQNRWPSLNVDLMAVNQLASKALAAGFYYKTFMGPVIGPLKGTRFWMFCEAFIRRAAGLGKAGTTPDSSRYERMNAFCDVLVVGGGEAGVGEALKAASDSKRVILCEQSHDTLSATKRDELESAGVTLLARTTAWGWYDGNTIAAVERVTDHMRKPHPGMPRQRHWVVRAQHVSLCTGALERPIVFPGNDRPGIMLASAAARFAEQKSALCGRNIAIFTNNDSAYAVAEIMRKAGSYVTAIIDVRANVSKAAQALAKQADAKLITGHAVIGTKGVRRIRAVTIAAYDTASKTVSGSSDDIACDTLLVSGGWSPVVHLASQRGSKPVWNGVKQAFLAPGPTSDDWSIHGAASGDLDFGHGLDTDPAPILHIDHPGKAFVDFQHDVTADDVKLAHREGFISVEHLKRYTTLGMATDQGKTSNVPGLLIMAETLGKQIPDVGTTRFRAPYTGVAIGALAAERFGHLQPHRLTPMHDQHAALGARMYEAALWMRPESYNQPGETVEQAYVREAKAVRTGAGIIDVSTLGKIDVQGPDAAQFLNRIYTNGFAKLAVGKARYGLMLREDGFVMDDGTTWRLSENRFLMTTTTANAAKVMQHMEKMLTVHWPDMRVHLTSVTDQWAGVAVAGPKSRAVLEASITGTSVDDETLPFMGIVYGSIKDIPVMICRLSFSGELAYEVYCGAHHGPAMWDAVMTAGQAHGITPYGLEALGTLRIEKGHVTGAEIDGRTTARDLHLDWMLSSKKPFIGSSMMDREGLIDEKRWTLVGLKSATGQKLKGGAHLVESAEPGSLSRSLGHVTAMCFSPELKTYVALALLENGNDFMGEQLFTTDPVRTGSHFPVDVVSHHMVDPSGERMRA